MTASPERPAVPPQPTRTGLDRSLAHGLAWTGLAKWGAQLLSWASTFVVVRLLTPTDYGIMGMALVYLGLVQMVSEFGLGTALIQERQLERSQIARLGGLSVILGVVVCLVSIALAPGFALFFGQSEVRPVIVVLAFTFIISSLQVVPNSLLARDLAFRDIAVVEGVAALIQTAVTLVLAVAGAGYWCLVLGAVAARVVSTIQFMWLRPHPLAWPRNLHQLTASVTFGWRVVISRVTWYVYSNADFAIVGRVLGAAPLGAYTFGWQIASVPVDKINAVLSRVALPVMAAVQTERPAVARYLLLLSEGLALVVLPASLGMALVAPDFVPVVLGDRWLAAVVPLQALSVHVTVRCVASLFSQGLIALDEMRQSVRLGVVQVLIMPPAFYLAARYWGVNGVALAWLVVHPVITIPLLISYTLRRVNSSMGDLARSLLPPATGAAVMVAAVLLAQLLLRGSSPVTRLAATVAVGAATYAGTMLGLHGARFRRIVAAVKDLRHA